MGINRVEIMSNGAEGEWIRKTSLQLILLRPERKAQGKQPPKRQSAESLEARHHINHVQFDEHNVDTFRLSLCCLCRSLLRPVQQGHRVCYSTFPVSK